MNVGLLKTVLLHNPFKALVELFPLFVTRLESIIMPISLGITFDGGQFSIQMLISTPFVLCQTVHFPTVREPKGCHAPSCWHVCKFSFLFAFNSIFNLY